MKTKFSILIMVGLLVTISLSSCYRSRLHTQGSQTTGNEDNSPAATQLVPLLTKAPTGQPVSTAVPDQSQPTSVGSVAQPTLDQPAVSSPEISQAADELSAMMDGLTKDLNAIDTMNDVKQSVQTPTITQMRACVIVEAALSGCKQSVGVFFPNV